jgi:hypothetical protein
VTAVDDILSGGLPVGAITELVGPECSGRTSLALSFLGGLTRAGRVCAWIDASDAFHPESAAGLGIDLTRLLWVRCRLPSAGAQQPVSYQFEIPEKYLVPPPSIQGLHGGGFGPHPRNEVKGLPDAVRNLLKLEAIPPRSTLALQQEQPETREPHQPSVAQRGKLRLRTGKPWSRIEQALSVTDLILQTGGFSAIVLDMAGIAPEFVSRIELATWFRYRAAAERTQASIILLTQYPCARSSAELLMRFEPGRAPDGEATVFTGIQHRLAVERRRFSQAPTNVVPLRKPPQRANVANWHSQSSWAGTR